MNLGFTGTHLGITPAQAHTLLVAICLGGESGAFLSLHHGDCVGADAQAASLAAAFNLRIIVHPPTDPKLRAFWKGNGLEVVLPEKPYLVRNHDIVDATDLLIACPAEALEPTRQRAGGTWATVRYARKKGKPIWIISPDGNLRKENV